LTPQEKKLAKRVHNQRVRLRQLEGMKDWHTGQKDYRLRVFWKEAWRKQSRMCRALRKAYDEK